MELKETFSSAPTPSVLGEIFSVTESNGRSESDRARALQGLHARLASPQFAAQMTGIFFQAKRAALAQSK